MRVRIESALAKRFNESLEEQARQEAQRLGDEGASAEQIAARIREILSERRMEVFDGDTPEMDLEGLFRFFNRVDYGDGERLERLGYLMPSMSMDDLVTVGGETYRVAAVGFERV